MSYKLIYADPPWQFSNKNTGGSMKSGAEAQYPTMTLEQLKSLDIPSICDDDCVLVMWWVSSQPKEAIELAESWGFTIKSMNGFVWNKLTAQHNPFFGMGFYSRAGSESALIAIRGKPDIKDHGVRAVLAEDFTDMKLVGSYPVGAHSAKPVEFRERCERLVGDVPKLEMFARYEVNGWEVFGNQAPDSISIRER